MCENRHVLLKKSVISLYNIRVLPPNISNLKHYTAYHSLNKLTLHIYRYIFLKN